MKKSKLNQSVDNFNNDMKYVVQTIIDAITAKGIRKKVLADERVRAICERYHIDIEELQ